MQKGTRAEGLKDRVPPETMKKRCKYLREIGQTKRKRFNERFISANLEVLIEGKRDPGTGYLKGFTRNYIPVLVKGTNELFHQVVQVKLDRIEDGRVFGLLK